MVGEGGLEPPTFHLSRIYSPLPSPLGYSPVWWALPESNQRRPALQAGALPAELRTHDGRGGHSPPQQAHVRKHAHQLHKWDIVVANDTSIVANANHLLRATVNPLLDAKIIHSEE